MAFSVLHIDDSVEDRFLMQEILESIAPDIELSSASSGEEGLEMLKTGLTPNIIMLDINMPGLDGFQVLEKLKSSLEFRKIPVLMFSVTTASHHINKAFELGANAVINKPLTLTEYKQVFVDTFQFWKNITRLPQ